MRVRRGAEFRRERHALGAGRAAQGDDGIPPGQVGVERRFRFRRAEVGHLRTLRMTDARVHVAHQRQHLRQRVRLVFQQRFAGTAPVRQVGRQGQVRILLQIRQQQHRVAGKAAAVDFMHDGHAVFCRDGGGQVDQLRVLRLAVVILARVGVDQHGARQAGVFQQFGQSRAVQFEVAVEHGFPLRGDQLQSRLGDAVRPFLAQGGVERQRHLDAVETGIEHLVDEDVGRQRVIAPVGGEDVDAHQTKPRTGKESSRWIQLWAAYCVWPSVACKV
ncbi:hypothetical protein D3C72_1086080 [compost metagenome]